MPQAAVKSAQALRLRLALVEDGGEGRVAPVPGPRRGTAAASAPPAAAPEPEVDFRAEPEEEAKPTRITDKQRRQFMMMGISLYGADGWDDKRPKLIEWVTKNRSKHTNDMTTEEAQKLIDGLAEKLRERDEPRAVAA